MNESPPSPRSGPSPSKPCPAWTPEGLSRLLFRETPRPDDIENVRRIVESTGFFHPEEVQIATELVEERLAKGMASGYFFLFADWEGRTLGYSCYGPIAGTAASYDLYWIAVHHEFRGQGIGKLLLRRSEEAVAGAGGRRIYIETSSTAQYQSTRAFYLNCGYKQEAVLEDFYRPGDSKVIYCKVL
ncbi:MAG TPA: GNAT family N-acetyltransferase [bacterium]|nr:GNAT family N-acetyltransferase [Candidatus Omnitrophota bacterium]HOJ58650.1 GNAT family N-acetyltransferase [bacterium]HOL94625.1 GNAT family N-acetyltransferase [bacterium]HPP00301.1 GNAT family N-acetyltransferase [bacterium]